MNALITSYLYNLKFRVEKGIWMFDKLFRIGYTIIISLLIVQVINVTQFQLSIGEFNYWGIEPALKNLFSESDLKGEKSEIEKVNMELDLIQSKLDKSNFENGMNKNKLSKLTEDNLKKEKLIREFKRNEAANKFKSQWLSDNEEIVSLALKPQIIMRARNDLSCSARSQRLLSQWLKIRHIARRFKSEKHYYRHPELKRIYIDLFDLVLSSDLNEVKEVVEFLIEARDHLNKIDGWQENLEKIAKASMDLDYKIKAADEGGYLFSDDSCLKNLIRSNYYSSLGLSYDGIVNLDYWAVSFWLRRAQEGSEELFAGYFKFSNNFILASNGEHKSKFLSKISLSEVQEINEFSDVAIIYGGQKSGEGTFSVSVLNDVEVTVKELYGKTKLGNLYRFNLEEVPENFQKDGGSTEYTFINYRSGWLSDNILFSNIELVDLYVLNPVPLKFSYIDNVYELIGLKLMSDKTTSPYCGGVVEVELYKHRPNWSENNSRLISDYYSVMEKCRVESGEYIYSAFHLLQATVEREYSLLWSGITNELLSHKNFMSDLDQDGNFEFHFVSTYESGSSEYLIELEEDGLKAKVLLNEEFQSYENDGYEFSSKKNTQFLTVN